LDAVWQKRIQDVKNCPDNIFIPRHVNAGKIQKGVQTMHNGLKIHLGSYYGAPISRMLYENGGVHEPQEERVFAAVLGTLSPESVMVELGAYWGFYSMWFYCEIESARCFLVEPNRLNMSLGKRNLRLNNAKGQFFSYLIDEKSDLKNGIICLDDFMHQQNLAFIDVLHADIQGAEYGLLLGAKKAFEGRKIGYIFLSTHSNDLHTECLDFLIKKQFIIIANADLNQTFSFDGLIVARHPDYKGIDKVEISLKHN
jgi:Methyltransferase FkbM domain